LALLVLWAQASRADLFTINTPGGPVQVDISHVGPQQSLVSPSPPESAGFRPPTIFSAPLAHGSGARALGLADAFTAVADDATAASWNPAGLTQLERPEASAVYRFSQINDRHTSGDNSFAVSKNDYGDDKLNYFSVVYPLHLGNRNVVVSLNYQEAYDFTQEFSAHTQEQHSDSVGQTEGTDYHKTQIDHIVNTNLDITVTSLITTHMESQLSQFLDSGLLSDLEFRQQGTIDALTPAFAVEINPRFSVGLALNVYGNFMGDPIRSTTTADYSGDSASYADIMDTRTTKATYEYHGTEFVRSGSYPPFSVPLGSTTGTYPVITSTTETLQERHLNVQGTYEEEDDLNDLSGINSTLGALWSVSSHLSLGFTVDLPWTASASQVKIIHNKVTTYDAASGSILDVEETSSTEQKDVELHFPLYWAAGAVWRWTDQLYSTLDVSQTRWSEFSFKADGEQKLNPLDGSPYGEHPIDDCWSFRYGMEYLLICNSTEIPLRGGVFEEERPAIGSPDKYYGFTLGTGVSVGKDPGKLILDVAYVYRQGDNVMGSLVPGQDSLKTDSVEHEVYVSSIWHF